MNREEWAKGWEEYSPAQLAQMAADYQAAEAHRKALAEPIEDPRDAPWNDFALGCGIAIVGLAYFGAAYALVWLGHWIWSLL